MSIASAPDLSVSLVTYNSAPCLDKVFEALERQCDARWELFVVDNASQDATKEKLRDKLRKQTSSSVAPPALTINPDNVGYGRAHNQNLDRFRGRYVLFLNPDMGFPPTLFAELIRLMDTHPHFGIAGPQIFESTDRREFQPRHFYPGEGMMALEPEWNRTSYAWISGCCLIIRTALLRELNGFDPGYFLYSEETDLCRRARQAGRANGWTDAVHVEHAGLQSQAGATPYQHARTLFTGVARFCEKHYPAKALPAMMRFQVVTAGAMLAAKRLGLQPAAPRLDSDRLRARRDVARSWLAQRGLPLLRADRSVLRIAARQLRIVARWVRTGTFPLDDY